jgi:hypothetical protein
LETVQTRWSCPPSILLGIAAALAMAFGAGRADAADPVRGGALYELRCGICHSASVHGRTKRLATDFTEIRQQVIRWSENLGLDWDHDDVDDVTVYLNGRYYRYACPPRLCTVISGRRRPGPG